MNIIKLILDLVIILLALVVIIVIGLKVSGFMPVVIETSSMSPALEPNTLIYIKQVPFEDINKEDIVTFRNSSGSVVTHRVMAVDSETLITKGDNNEFIDVNPVNSEDIMGKYFFKIPYSGYVIGKYKEFRKGE